MKKHRKTIIIVVVIVLILVLAYFNRKKPVTTNTQQLPPVNNSSDSGSGSSSNSSCTENTILKKGTQCTEAVKHAQQRINQFRWLYAIPESLIVDGIFGDKTESAFKKILGKSTGSLNELTNKII